MGQVFRALDTRLNRTVAIKMLPSTHVADPGSKETLPAGGAGGIQTESPEYRHAA